jgi:hypothetical protein
MPIERPGLEWIGYLVGSSRPAVFFRIGVLAYNIGRLFVLLTLDKSWHHYQVQTLRWKVYGAVGKIVFHGRSVYLKVNRSLQKPFSEVRMGTWEFAQTQNDRFWM